MSGSLLSACLWAAVATGSGWRPARARHWRAAHWLIAAGIPILGWVTYRNGPWAGLVALAAGAAILRWPRFRLWRRRRRRAAN